MLRIALGIIVGIVLGSIVFMAFQMLNGVFFPLPEGVSYTDQESMKKFVGSLPPTGFILVLVGYAVGSLASAFVARKISRHANVAAPIILGAFFTLGWVLNSMTIPHPFWVTITGYLMFLPFTFLGHRLAAD